jgi:hypothetical protein
MQKERFPLQFVIMILLFTIPGMAQAAEYTGYLDEEGSGGSWSATAEIPLTLANLTSLHFDGVSTDPCGSNQTQARLKRLQNDGSRTGINVNLNLGDYILTEGDYIVEITCTRSQPPEPYTLGYTLTTTQSAIQPTYNEDTEPDENPGDASVLTQTRVMEGYLGADGYPLPAYHLDGSDTYFLKVEEKKTVRIKLEYDASFINNPALAQSGGGDLSVFLGIYNSEHAFPHNAWVPLDNWSESGFVSDPINLYYGDALGAPLTFGIVVSRGNGWHPPVGSYKLSILEENPGPEPEPEGLFVTIQEALWHVREIRDGYMFHKEHFLDVKFEVRNQFNTTKTINNWVEVSAPIVHFINMENEIYNSVNGYIYRLSEMGCSADGIEWSKMFQGKCQPTTDSSLCMTWTTGESSGEATAIPAHTAWGFTVSIPVPRAEYANFDDAFQLVRVETRELGVERPICDLHASCFWPVWAMLPAVNLLLGQ